MTSIASYPDFPHTFHREMWKAWARGYVKNCILQTCQRLAGQHPLWPSGYHWDVPPSLPSLFFPPSLLVRPTILHQPCDHGRRKTEGNWTAPSVKLLLLKSIKVAVMECMTGQHIHGCGNCSRRNSWLLLHQLVPIHTLTVKQIGETHRPKMK